jgi:DNA-directed RNA polymerase subunit RPC12/RpoP
MAMLARLWCAIWGHAVHNEAFARHGRYCTRCGEPMLDDDGADVRIGHTLSCFLRHHTFREVGRRHDHTEYACVRCGHPLLFRSDADPYRDREDFAKKVRYLCGLFGHRVHTVAERDGGVEYACHCGHSFVHQPHRLNIVRHPLSCVLVGHWVSFVRTRGAFGEFACRTCGHPFLFAGRAPVSARARRRGQAVVVDRLIPDATAVLVNPSE